MMFIKLTLFLLYMYIFRQNSKLKRSIYIGATLNIAFYTSVIITQFIFVTPPHGTSLVEYFVSPRFSKVIILSTPLVAVGLAIDLYLLILPISGVIQLNLPTRRKIAVSLIFLTGIL